MCKNNVKNIAIFFAICLVEIVLLMIEKKEINISGFENIKNTTVCADRDMIYQVVYNLIDNAVKFTQQGGEIEVSAERKIGGSVIVSIKNSGEGIDSEEISRIFERFYKVDQSRSTDVKSTGLGLYLIKSIVELHNGTVTVESKVDNFTRFTVKLPR